MSKGFQVLLGGGRWRGSLRELGGDRAEVLAVGLGDVLLERTAGASSGPARGPRCRASRRGGRRSLRREAAEGHEDHAVVRELRDEGERRRLRPPFWVPVESVTPGGLADERARLP